MMETGNIVAHDEAAAEVNRLSLISWGSVLAGLVFIVAISWLLNLLGMAIGVSAADAADATSISGGFGISAVIWIVISSMIVYFLGAMLTARLSGKHDKTTGMLHGVTLWGVTTTLMLVLGFIGITGLLQTGQSLLSSTASTVVNTASALGSGTSDTASYIAQQASDAEDSKIVNKIQAKLKRHASSLIADADPKGGAEISQRDVRETIDQLDSDALEKMATQLIDGDTEQAKETLANNSGLSEQEIDTLIESMSQEVQEMLGTENIDDGLTAEIQNRVKQRFARFASDLDAPGGPNVSSQDIQQALEQIDMQTLQSVATRLIMRDTESAKDVLIANTNLTDAQIDDLVDGVNREVEQTITKYQNELNSATEAVATYSQAVLWAVFSASAIGLLLSILGGAMGAATTQRLYVASRQTVLT
ncbi:MAG: hypothetical protein NMNS01_28020 [Nitrosomonas sp.]|nr:MAG: hypothetical protein NMNS01_28020 [Nitrosomonas sp.]